MRINRISNKIQAIDSWARKIGGCNFIHLKFGREFDREKIRRAFGFIEKYNIADDLDRAVLESGKHEAETLLKRFEQYQDDLKREEDMKAEKRRDLEAKFRKDTPVLFAKKIKPLFEQLASEIRSLEETPGFIPHVAYASISNELTRINQILKTHKWRKI